MLAGNERFDAILFFDLFFFQLSYSFSELAYSRFYHSRFWHSSNREVDRKKFSKMSIYFVNFCLIKKLTSCKLKLKRELVDERNIQYLGCKPSKKIHCNNYHFWPKYAASQVFFSSFTDIIMAKVKKIKKNRISSLYSQKNNRTLIHFITQYFLINFFSLIVVY